jgi:transcriptional regulator with XRE-family HTH domain
MNILKRLRAEKRLTLRELASKSKVNINAIMSLEKGLSNARPVTIDKLAVALEVDITVLEPLMNQVDNFPKTKAAA